LASHNVSSTVVGCQPPNSRRNTPTSTVRGWLRAFAGNAEPVRAVCTALLADYDRLTGPVPARGSGLADAVEAVGACAAAAVRRLGVLGAVSPWQLASAVTGGRLLGVGAAGRPVNTNWPLGTAG
jgi:hypothetical protein